MNGQHHTSGRSVADAQPPAAQLRNLSLNSRHFDAGTSATASHSGLTSPSSAPNRQDYMGSAYPSSYNNAGFHNVSPPRTSYPPANPADQNPPCNTLYVGNLPNSTSEDELKRLFSVQRGYKRLCFRTKANGPMCFVEFESVTLATQALHHLYGKMLSNSIKGGMRLSFSKNPLGVRNSQNAMPPHAAMSPQGPPPGFGNNMHPPPGFNNAALPPPGLSTSVRNAGFAEQMDAAYRSPPFGGHGSSGPFASQLQMPQSTSIPPGPPPVSNYGGSGYVHAHTGAGMR